MAEAAAEGLRPEREEAVLFPLLPPLLLLLFVAPSPCRLPPPSSFALKIAARSSAISAARKRPEEGPK